MNDTKALAQVKYAARSLSESRHNYLIALSVGKVLHVFYRNDVAVEQCDVEAATFLVGEEMQFEFSKSSLRKSVSADPSDKLIIEGVVEAIDTNEFTRAILGDNAVLKLKRSNSILTIKVAEAAVAYCLDNIKVGDCLKLRIKLVPYKGEIYGFLLKEVDDILVHTRR